MLLEEIKSVLSFAAFRPDADDPNISWSKRFENRKALLLNVSRNQTSWRGINRKGKFEEGGMQEGEFADIAPQRAEDWRGMTDGGWCVVSLNNRFIISLENNLMRGDNCMHLLRTNPRANSVLRVAACSSCLAFSASCPALTCSDFALSCFAAR